jgi:hypothetical protein
VGAKITKLVDLTGNCLDPRTNFKGSKGESVKELLAEIYDKGIPYCQEYVASVPSLMLSLDQPSNTTFNLCKQHAADYKF